LDDFKRNPQQFIELAAEVINRSKRLAIVAGIKYQRIGNEEYFIQELFEDQELSGYMKSMMDSDRSVHEQVIYQSETEHTFAENLEHNDAIKVYAKLPSGFKIPTPLGPYNPDWAVLVEQDGRERVYFIVETKSSLYTDDLRPKELAKTECGKAHFKAIATDPNPARYKKATKVEDLFVDIPAVGFPFEIVPASQAQPYITHLPLYSLKAAAGKFSGSQDVSEEGWIPVHGHKLDPQMFVAQVVGKSMEPRIPDGSYCIFRANPVGSRQGKIVLAQYHGLSDPDTGGQYTVKKYQSKKNQNPDGTWEHEEIRLEPLNPAYQSIVISPENAVDARVLAEWIDLLKK